MFNIRYFETQKEDLTCLIIKERFFICVNAIKFKYKFIKLLKINLLSYCKDENILHKHVYNNNTHKNVLRVHISILDKLYISIYFLLVGDKLS
jgi:hypothetical protein